MSATLGTSPCAETRIAFALRTLERWSGEPQVRILTPTRGAGDDLVRRLDLAPGRAGLYRYTPLQLALETAAVRLAEEGLAPVGGIALDALTVRAIHGASREDRLEYFQHIAHTVGFSRALRRTLSELRLEELPPGALRGRGPSGQDLEILLGAFGQELLSGRLADPAAIYGMAAECLRAPRATAPDWPVLLLDTLPGSRAETRFLAALAGHTREMVAVALPQSERGLRNLETALAARARPLGGEPAGRTLDRIRSWVFAREAGQAGDADGSLTFFSATDDGRECVEIARYIQSAAAQGVRFDDIAVLLRNPEAWQPLVEEALARAGIPAFYTNGSERPNPSGRAFLALLGCRSEDFSASRFAEYLSLGQVPAPETDGPWRPQPPWVPVQGELFPEESLHAPDAASPGPDPGDSDDAAVIAGGLRAPYRWEQLLMDASVVGGADRWESRLDGLCQELLAQIEAVAPHDEARERYLERRLGNLEQLRAFALPVIGQLARLPGEAFWGDWLEHLEALAQATLRQPDHVLATLGELRPMSQTGPVTLEDVSRVLADRLTLLRTELTGRRYGRVFVSTIPEAAGRSFGMVFVPGLSEGVFPHKSLEDPLLLDAFRAGTAAWLRVNRDRIQEERLLLHIAVGCARDRLLVSYPRMDVGQGRARVPSFYALDILRAGEGSIPDLGELERRAVETSRSRLGWPSPRAPREAIDDAEYDLATIGGLLQSSPSEVRGRARYLLEANPALARSLRSRARRWKNFWSPADGLVDPGPATLEILRSYRLGNRAHSATALEQMAACPYRFLLRAVHRLYPREDIVRIERLDPLTRGSLFHTVQFRLLSELARKAMLPITHENSEEARRHADSVLDDTAAEYRARLAPAIGRVWEAEIEGLRADLGGWLLREAEQNAGEPGWVPRHFEFAFGLDVSRGDRDPGSVPGEAVLPGRFRLRGAVDLIEEHGANRFLRIVDHKTGRPPAQTPRATGNGETLQPLLYAAAAEALLGQTVSVSTLSFCTQRGGFRKIEIPVDDETRRQLQDTLAEIDRAIETGFLPAAPRDGACAHCDYRIVCGPYEELRTRRKQRERLDGLDKIRSIP